MTHFSLAIAAAFIIIEKFNQARNDSLWARNMWDLGHCMDQTFKIYLLTIWQNSGPDE
jgi:hypothetical protein